MVTRLIGRKLGMSQYYATDVLKLKSGETLTGTIEESKVKKDKDKDKDKEKEKEKVDSYDVISPSGHRTQVKKADVESFTRGGRCFPVTVLQAGPCKVTQLKTKARDGYSALQIAFGSRRPRNVSRAVLGHLLPPGDVKKEERPRALDRSIKDLKEAPEILREIPWDEKEEVKVGDAVTVDIFQKMKKVDVVGTSKGRGFMGVVRRWGFHGLPATHGQSDRERAPGSLGRQHSISQGVYPGKRMAGHWGVEQVTSRNLEVIRIDREKNILVVHGAVPGPTGGIVLIQEAHWTPPKPPTVVSKKQKASKK